MCIIISLLGNRTREEDGKDDDEDNNAENILDEGIVNTDSDSDTGSNDYLVSSVTKSDLDVISMLSFRSDKFSTLRTFLC